MSHEQESPLVNREPLQLFAVPLKVAQGIEGSLRRPFIKTFISMLLPFIERKLVKTMVPEFPQKFEIAFGEQMKDQNTVPIIVSSHEGHADAITMVALSKILTNLANQTSDPQKNDSENRLKGFQLLVAASMRAGHQGLLIQESVVQAEKKYFPHKYPLTFVDYVREKDVGKYGMEPNKIAFTRRLIRAVNERYGIAVFPEASVESGRKDGKNRNAIKGMQPINCENLRTVIKIIIHQGKSVLLIPVGSHGAYKIVDSNLDKKSGEPANRITLKELKALLGKDANKLISARVGMPIKYEDIINELMAQRQGKQPTEQDISDLLGKKIAQLLPESARGVYA